MESELDKSKLGKKVGARIKEIRKEKSISQAELARRSGKDKQHVELIENNKISANFFTIYLIIRALDVSLKVFFSRGFEDSDNF